MYQKRRNEGSLGEESNTHTYLILGIKRVVGIDFCQNVVEFMESRKVSKNYEELKYDHMDCRGNLIHLLHLPLTFDVQTLINFLGLRFDSGRFDIVVDKGCLDCLVCTDAKFEESQKYIELCLCEAARVMNQTHGFYVLVSCSFDQQKLDKFFQVSRRFGWKLVSEASLGQNSKFPAKITVYKKIK